MDRCFGMVLLVVYEVLKDVSLNNFVIFPSGCSWKRRCCC